MLERKLRLVVDQASGHDEMLRHPQGASLLEVPDFRTRDLVQFASRDIFIDLGGTFPIRSVGTAKITRVMRALERTVVRSCFSGRTLRTPPVLCFPAVASPRCITVRAPRTTVLAEVAALSTIAATGESVASGRAPGARPGPIRSSAASALSVRTAFGAGFT
ncbi:hypothetical protein GCM10009784_24090 [Arthrobacter parietis]|uniref:Uncharacterized protein n=1 Tax=Arthrobacter parietis TaxID=271434 RepID=A0ABN3AZQ0_9MICC